MTRFQFTMAVAAISCVSAVQPMFGQGCIISRSNGQVGGPESEGGYLQAGEFQAQVGYRHQFSFRHFVGPVEQSYRIQQGTQVMNKINLQNFALTYQLTSRFSVTADVPLLLASRHTHNSPITYTTSGIGDVAFMVNGWVWNPKENTRGNVQLGIGLLLPTGKNNITNVVDAFDGKGPQTKVVDYSVQPGQGGWGIPFQWVGYKNVGSSQLYLNGSYTAMLQSINLNTLRSTTVNALTLTQYNSISDQYLLEAGIAHPVSKIKGLTLTVGPRMEGAPARNLFPGDNLGFRRPGFAISIEPGFQYSRGGSVFTAQVGKAFYRDRTRSVPDTITGGHGDAAFADYVWLASYSYRFNRHGGVHADHDMPDHSQMQHPAGDHSAASASAGTSAGSAKSASLD
jgi:hypothetical protein